jgi:hypothetical protein
MKSRTSTPPIDPTELLRRLVVQDERQQRPADTDAAGLAVLPGIPGGGGSPPAIRAGAPKRTLM